MGLEFVFELLKKFQDQGDKDEMKIINGEFYYKGQVMDKVARKLFYEMKAEEEKRKLGKVGNEDILTEVKSKKEEVRSEDLEVMENLGEYTPEGVSLKGKRGRPPKIEKFFIF